MRRERVLRDLQQPGKIARSETIRLVPDQRPEGLKTGRLGQGGEGQDGFFGFHISRLMEVWRLRQSESEARHRPRYFEYSRNTVDGTDQRVHCEAMKIDDAAARLEALGNRTRLQIYRALVRAGRSGMPVGRLQDKLKIPASTLSHHIKTLVSVGLVSQVRESTTLICHANFDAMRGLVDFLAAECCADEVGCKTTQTAA
jgi:DNA-binding transcriptional ArsR family regulator